MPLLSRLTVHCTRLGPAGMSAVRFSVMHPSPKPTSCCCYTGLHLPRSNGIAAWLCGAYCAGPPQTSFTPCCTPYCDRRVSGPMGEVKPYTLVDDPSAWTAADWAGKEQEFTYELSDADIDEVEAAGPASPRPASPSRCSAGT